MARAGDVLEMAPLGMRIAFEQTAADTGGESLVYEVSGRPRGFPARPHVHPRQTERHEVKEGALAVEIDGRKRTLSTGESVVIPAAATHRHFAAGTGQARVRVELRPALRTEQLLEYLAALCRDGAVTKRGYPRPLATAHLIADFPDEGRAAQPPPAVQRALAHTLLALETARERSGREYAFVDEWDVQAPAEAVFEALADARTYPDWWRAVYLEATADGPPAVGVESRQHFKGRFPYHLHTRSRIVELEAPRRIVADVDGDLRGRGTWTLGPAAGGATHVRFDWVVHADRPLLRTLTPVLRPAFRWNHSWAIARAREGLEPYARGRDAS